MDNKQIMEMWFEDQWKKQEREKMEELEKSGSSQEMENAAEIGNQK